MWTYRKTLRRHNCLIALRSCSCISDTTNPRVSYKASNYYEDSKYGQGLYCCLVGYDTLQSGRYVYSFGGIDWSSTRKWRNRLLWFVGNLNRRHHNPGDQSVSTWSVHLMVCPDEQLRLYCTVLYCAVMCCVVLYYIMYINISLQIINSQEYIYRHFMRFSLAGVSFLVQ